MAAPYRTAILRQGLLAILNRTDEGVHDLRRNVLRMAAVLDDLTRSRVVGLTDADFADYVRLTVPFAAADPKPVITQEPGIIGRLLQRGFLFVVAATRLKLAGAATRQSRERCQRPWLVESVPPTRRSQTLAAREPSTPPGT